jgi:hypothetical protein
MTDGMLERNVSTIDVPAAILKSENLHPREVVRALADSALSAAGHALQDDATLLCLDWHGMHGQSRESESGQTRYARVTLSNKTSTRRCKAAPKAECKRRLSSGAS